MVNTLCFDCRGTDVFPDQATKILQAAWYGERGKEETKKEREKKKKKEGRKGEMGLPVEEILKRDQEDKDESAISRVKLHPRPLCRNMRQTQRHRGRNTPGP